MGRSAVKSADAHTDIEDVDSTGAYSPVAADRPGGEVARSAAGARPVPPRLIAAILFILVAYLAWAAVGGIGPEALGDLAFLPMGALSVFACWRAGERAAAVPGMRWGWRLIGLGLASYTIGDLTQIVYELGGELPNVSFADPFYLAFYPLALIGILRFPWGSGTLRRRRMQALFDSATMAIGGAVLVWYLVLGPTASSGTGELAGDLVEVFYPGGDLVLIMALVRLWTLSPASSIRRSVAWLSVGLAIFVAADVTYVWLVLHSTFEGGGWLDLSWLAATAAFVIAPTCQPVLSVEDVTAGAEVEEEPGIWAIAIPFLAVAVVFGLLIGTQAEDTFFPGLSLTLAAVLVAILVSARLFLGGRDLAKANVELREAHAELAALATTDPLTGLPNHRALVDAVDRELDRARRYERRCSLLFIDIDYFKALNDGCGHSAGDTVLRELGEVMLRSLRTIDTVGRWGGEEFVAVLPEVDSEAAMATAERLRATVADHIFAIASGIHVTVSVGASSYPRDGEARGALLEAADRAMYTAKRMGRNQVFDAADPTVGALRDGEGSGSDADERATMGAVDALAMLVDTRDRGTGDHVTHVATLAERVALALGCTPKQARQTYFAAKLHDIGKVAVADAILRKPGRLTDEEWKLMRQHPAIGADVVSRIGRLASIAPIIRAHHERYDGDGYPEGLRGEEIPLEARIVGVADAFDAMISDRPYRRRMSLEQAREELRRCAGTQFDPDVVDALERIIETEYERGAA